VVEIGKCVQKGNLFNVFKDNLLKSLQIDAYLHQFSITAGKPTPKVLFCIFGWGRGLED
jgi:hypothetical protein